jgi:hypothetical protein
MILGIWENLILRLELGSQVGTQVGSQLKFKIKLCVVLTELNYAGNRLKLKIFPIMWGNLCQ